MFLPSRSGLPTRRSFEMAKTTDNLMKMFTSGSEAAVRYLAFAEAAHKEGYPGVAKIFRALSKSKMFLALSHLQACNVVDNTRENLKQAMEEEIYDYKTAYPAVVRDAVADEALEARHSLEYGMSIGPILTKLIGKAAGDPAENREGSYYVCPVCGNIEFGKPPGKCPFCGVDGKDFVEVP
jgi:rubrerythrin